jgi:NADH pyrophosphatase NudC (nudix superfamily)
MRLDVHLAILLASSTGVGFLMLLSGVQKNALEWRRRRRFCPSCGRQISGRTCACSAR